MHVTHKNGFTLIELLVVVAIIAVLVSLLLPAIASVRAMGRQTVCLNNLRQVGLAAIEYSYDYNGLIPRGSASSGLTLDIWFIAFLPYLEKDDTAVDYRDVKIYRCSSYPNKEQAVCYVSNGWTFASRADTVGHEARKPTPITSFDRPGRTIYLADNSYGTWRPIVQDIDDLLDRCDVWSVNHLPSSTGTGEGNGRRVARDRHKLGVNAMFIDGHSQWVESMPMTADAWRDHWN